ncbi:PO113 protein, partial [Campylorhamphus procurvoides]|nr:PO113 protein [Campylorhamphus procurvoides]
EPQRWVQEHPLQDALTVFTDAGRKSKKAACVWQIEERIWEHFVFQGTANDSLQTLELKAVSWALQQWPSTRLNIVSDSQYVVGIVNRIEEAAVRVNKNEGLYLLF